MVFAHHGQKLLTVNEAAARLNVGRARIYDLIAQGVIRSVKIGGSRRISERAVDEYIDQLEAESAAGRHG
jgi:excisionase family DNA binding protein